ncbi:MAG: MMPL family transporter, partial [Thermoguttaceae bacterium]
PASDLKQIGTFTQEIGQIAQGQWARLNIENTLNAIRMRLCLDPNQALNLSAEERLALQSLQNSGQGASEQLKPEQIQQMTLHELDLVSASLSKAFAAKPTYGSPWPQIGGYPGMPEVVTACSQNDTGYFIVPGTNGVDAMGFALVRLASDKTENNSNPAGSSSETAADNSSDAVAASGNSQGAASGNSSASPTGGSKGAQGLAGGLAQGSEAIEKLRELIRETKKSYPDLYIGLTGLPVMENDEMQLSQMAMNKASILAFIGVCCIFFAGMGGFRHPLLVSIVLIIGFGWTAGFILLAIGHLNILSIAFGAILIGLGADFSVHYISRYMQLRQGIRSPSEAIVTAGETVGPGILTGAVTTAAAFFMAGFTEFTGIVELGIISGGGIILCCMATLFLVPALIQLCDGGRPMRRIPSPINVISWIKPFYRFPSLTICAGVAMTLLLCTGLSNVWYDHNLLNLQPEGLESVELEKKLLQSGGQNAWYALSIADNKDELLRRKERFAEKYPELQVTEIVSMIPGPDTEKQKQIAYISQNLAGLPERPPMIPISHPDKVGQSIAQLQRVLGNDPLSQDIARRLNQVRQTLRSMSESDCCKLMQDYQNAAAGDLLSRLHILKEMSNPNPPEMNDLPEPFVSRFMSKGGKHLMRIYSSADIWNMDEMEQFVKKVRDIDPKATGSPLQTYEASLQMQRGYQNASVYAFFAIVFLIFFDFRSIRDMILSLIPMLCGMVQALGILGLLEIPLNPANMIAIPLILGIGVDYGVHVVHDFRQQSGKYRLSASTASSILITSLTTIIGFGSLMIASHRGLQSLGRVLVIGMSCSLFCSIVLLPALLTLLTRKRQEVEAEENVVNEFAVDEINQQLLNQQLLNQRLRKKTKPVPLSQFYAEQYVVTPVAEAEEFREITAEISPDMAPEMSASMSYEMPSNKPQMPQNMPSEMSEMSYETTPDMSYEMAYDQFGAAPEIAANIMPEPEVPEPVNITPQFTVTFPSDEKPKRLKRRNVA